MMASLYVLGVQRSLATYWFTTSYKLTKQTAEKWFVVIKFN